MDYMFTNYFIKMPKLYFQSPALVMAGKRIEWGDFGLYSVPKIHVIFSTAYSALLSERL